MAPDLNLAVEDRGERSGTTFVRWSGGGTLDGVPISIEAVDCVRCDADGLVIENRIFSTHPIFEILAARRPSTVI